MTEIAVFTSNSIFKHSIKHGTQSVDENMRKNFFFFLLRPFIFWLSLHFDLLNESTCYTLKFCTILEWSQSEREKGGEGERSTHGAAKEEEERTNGWCAECWETRVKWQKVHDRFALWFLFLCTASILVSGHAYDFRDSSVHCRHIWCKSAASISLTWFTYTVATVCDTNMLAGMISMPQVKREECQIAIIIVVDGVTYWSLRFQEFCCCRFAAANDGFVRAIQCRGKMKCDVCSENMYFLLPLLTSTCHTLDHCALLLPPLPLLCSPFNYSANIFFVHVVLARLIGLHIN